MICIGLMGSALETKDVSNRKREWDGEISALWSKHQRFTFLKNSSYFLCECNTNCSTPLQTMELYTQEIHLDLWKFKVSLRVLTEMNNKTQLTKWPNGYIHCRFLGKWLISLYYKWNILQPACNSTLFSFWPTILIFFSLSNGFVILWRSPSSFVESAQKQ